MCVSPVPTCCRRSLRKFGSPLLVIDCDLIRRQYHALAAALPGVDLHYALKPLPDATVVQVLAREGAWFDLATDGEVDLVRSAGTATDFNFFPRARVLPVNVAPTRG